MTVSEAQYQLFKRFHILSQHSYQYDPYLAAKEAVTIVGSIIANCDVDSALALAGLNPKTLRANIADFKADPTNFDAAEIVYLTCAAQALACADDVVASLGSPIPFHVLPPIDALFGGRK